MSAPHTEHRSTARLMLDRFTGAQPMPPGKRGKAWGIVIFVLAPFFVYYAFTRDEPLLWDLFVLLLAIGGVVTILSRLWHRRRRLAYALNATGALVFQAGMIAFIVGLGIRGEWGFFGYALFVYGGIVLLTAAGVFYPDSSTRDGQRAERS